MSDTNEVKKLQDDIRGSLFDLFQIDKMPEDKQEEAVSSLGQLVFQSVLMRILPDMSDEDLDTYEKMLDKNPEPEELFGFFLEKRPDFLQVTMEEMNKLRNDAQSTLGGEEKKEE